MGAKLLFRHRTLNKGKANFDDIQAIRGSDYEAYLSSLLGEW